MQGEDGYNKVKAAVEEGRPYTLAFCDMRMPPGWDGLTTIEKLWEADPNLQVVICSAYSDSTWTDISQRLGHSDRLLILKKPFDNVEVLQLAVALIEKRRLVEAASRRQEELENIVRERTLHLNEARRESERILNSIDSLMIQLDCQQVVQRWNHAAGRIFDISMDQAVECSFLDLPIEWDDFSTIQSLICSETQESTARVQVVFMDQDNKARVVGLSSYPIFEDNEFKGRLILGTELTKQNQIEHQLNQAQKLESVGQLAAGVAHEINTPMQYVGDNLQYVNTKFQKYVGFYELATELVEAAEQADFETSLVEKIREYQKKQKLEKLSVQIPEALTDSIDGVGHVSRIVRAMKELSHPGGDEKSAVDINKSLDTTITVSTNEWKYVADVKTDFQPELDMVEGLPGELKQVFLNLIVNAAHAISDQTDGGNEGRGTISISTRQVDDHVLIQIQDTGGGIPENVRKRVFDPFFTTKGIGKGTGQGLAIAHSVIVQKHGGRIAFDVEEGVGTTFNIEIPFKASEAEATH